MARMTPDDRKDYNRLARWAEGDLPKSLDVEKIVDAFTTISGLDLEEARIALGRFDTDPWLHVRRLAADQYGYPINAQFQPASPNRIVISRDVALRFEQVWNDDDAKRFVQAKVLHEMVHWANFHKNLIKSAEAGEEFELKAYERLVTPPRSWPTSAPATAAGSSSPVEASTPVPDTSRGTGSAYPNHNYGPTAPRGLRNNNPGNLKKGIPWLGLLPEAQQTDGTFLQFSEMVYGIRAMARCLRSYATKSGIRTIAAMSSRWAPSIDGNHPGQYARTVVQYCRSVAASVDQPIDLADADVAFGVIRGIMVAENGSLAEQVPDSEVRRGIVLERAA